MQPPRLNEASAANAISICSPPPFATRGAKTRLDERQVVGVDANRHGALGVDLVQGAADQLEHQLRLDGDLAIDDLMSHRGCERVQVRLRRVEPPAPGCAHGVGGRGEHLDRGPPLGLGHATRLATPFRDPSFVGEFLLRGFVPRLVRIEHGLRDDPQIRQRPEREVGGGRRGKRASR